MLELLDELWILGPDALFDNINQACKKNESSLRAFEIPDEQSEESKQSLITICNRWARPLILEIIDIGLKLGRACPNISPFFLY